MFNTLKSLVLLSGSLRSLVLPPNHENPQMQQEQQGCPPSNLRPVTITNNNNNNTNNSCSSSSSSSDGAHSRVDGSGGTLLDPFLTFDFGVALQPLPQPTRTPTTTPTRTPTTTPSLFLSSSSPPTQVPVDVHQGTPGPSFNDFDVNGNDDGWWNPRVTTIESYPARKGFNSISLPQGSIWCNGAPTFWIVGHQNESESPWCYTYTVSQERVGGAIGVNAANAPTVPAATAAWQRNDNVVLDTRDERNGNVDRHSCATIDVNRDGLPDIVCGVGADHGTGTGYTELYITTPTNDSNSSAAPTSPKVTLKKVHDVDGLQKYPTMRSRRAVVLKNQAGVAEFVFIATLGRKRKDGAPNFHRMFRNNYTQQDKFPYFVEVDGPWNKYLFDASCAVVADFTGDGIDDLVVCDRKGPPLLVEQQPPQQQQQQPQQGSLEDFGFTNFSAVNINIVLSDQDPSDQSNYSNRIQKWRNVRMADVTGDGLRDLIVVTWQRQLFVFQGTLEKPYFNFRDVYFQLDLPNAAPDVEVLDVNRDNIPDIYVVQTNEFSATTYCGYTKGDGSHLQRLWWGDGSSAQPPANWTPPLDDAPDLLLMGRGNTSSSTTKLDDHYQIMILNHSHPGCGWIAHKFNDQTMLLGQGSESKPGHSLLLEWQ